MSTPQSASHTAHRGGLCIVYDMHTPFPCLVGQSVTVLPCLCTRSSFSSIVNVLVHPDSTFHLRQRTGVLLLVEHLYLEHWFTPGLRTTVLLLYCWIMNMQYNILQYFNSAIQYIAILKMYNTIYFNTLIQQYNILQNFRLTVQYIAIL